MTLNEMKKAIAIIEFSTIAAGIHAADRMAKTADIELVASKPVCPGKYLTVIAGLISAVTASVEAAKANFGERYINSFVLGNPHESLLPAFCGNTRADKLHTLGVLETLDAASLVYAADIAAKTAVVELIEIRLARGMSGKSFVTFTGEVAAVEAALARAKAVTVESGMYLDSCVIANPDEKLTKFILRD
jgi:microcompartment protein CcmL/EutN